MPTFDAAQQALRDQQPAPSPEGQFSDISQLFSLGREARVGNALAGIAGRAAASDLNYKSETADYNRRAAISALEEQSKSLKKKASGEGFERRLNSNGGFDFFDPTGNKVSAYDYAKATGTPLPTALSGSLDPRQRSFVDDFTFATQAPQVVQSYAELDPKLKTAKKIAEIRKKAADPKRAKDLTPEEMVVADYTDLVGNYPDIVKKTPQDVVRVILQEYQDIFNAPTFAGTGPTAPELPQPQPNFFQNIISALRR